jgi:hypothetical protein
MSIQLQLCLINETEILSGYCKQISKLGGIFMNITLSVANGLNG